MVDSLSARYPGKVGRELKYNRAWILAIFLAVTFLVLGLGTRWPKLYESALVVHFNAYGVEADAVNALSDLITDAGYVSQVLAAIDNNDEAAKNRLTAERLSSRLSIEAVQDYIRIGFQGSSSATVVRVLRAIDRKLAAEAADSRLDSGQVPAMQLIDTQIADYEEQLQALQARLEPFLAQSDSGAEDALRNKIVNLQDEIEVSEQVIKRNVSLRDELELRLRDVVDKRAAKKEELKRQESLLVSLNQELGSLRETYQANVNSQESVRLQSKIDDLSSRIASLEEGLSEQYLIAEGSEKTALDLANADLAMAERELLLNRAEQDELQRQLSSAKKRLNDFASAEHEFEVAESDYQVVSKIYEGLIKQREAMRGSFVKSANGYDYKLIQQAYDPAPTGWPQFKYFAWLAPVIGLLVVVALVVLKVMLNRRVVTPAALMGIGDEDHFEVIGVIPHYQLPAELRLAKWRVFVLVMLLSVFAAFYALIVSGHLFGYDNLLGGLLSLYER